MAARSKTSCTVIALTALLAAACGSEDAAVTSAPPSSSAPISAPASSSSSPPNPGAEALTPAPEAPAPVDAADSAPESADGAGSPPPNERVVPCVDPSSPVVQDAIAGLWAPIETGWTVIDHTPGTSAEGCPTISWALARDTTTGNGTYYSHVMFFHSSGRYIGQASGKPYSYTTVVGATDTSVDVRYNWLADGDSFCCPTGGPSVMTFEYDGTVMNPRGDTGHFPPPTA